MKFEFDLSNTFFTNWRQTALYCRVRHPKQYHLQTPKGNRAFASYSIILSTGFFKENQAFNPTYFKGFRGFLMVIRRDKSKGLK